MKLSKYLESEQITQTEMAKRLGVTQGMVWLWLNGRSAVALEKCMPIETASGGKVRRWDLRPDDWFVHWPELIGSPGAPKLPAKAKVAA